jgi:hypothetical protein
MADEETGLGVTGLNKEAVKGLATSVFSSCKELVFTTVSVNGNLEFTAWEWVGFSSHLLWVVGLRPLDLGAFF